MLLDIYITGTFRLLHVFLHLFVQIKEQLHVLFQNIFEESTKATLVAVDVVNNDFKRPVPKYGHFVLLKPYWNH